jgi:cadmium resistance protein CadD (predicted permease)
LLQTSAELLLTISIFYALFAMMLVVAFYLLRFPPLARFLTKFGVWIRPFLLIGLGIFILTESVIFERADEAGETTSAAAGAGGIVDND